MRRFRSVSHFDKLSGIGLPAAEIPNLAIANYIEVPSSVPQTNYSRPTNFSIQNTGQYGFNVKLKGSSTGATFSVLESRSGYSGGQAVTTFVVSESVTLPSNGERTITLKAGWKITLDDVPVTPASGSGGSTYGNSAVSEIAKTVIESHISSGNYVKNGDRSVKMTNNNDVVNFTPTANIRIEVVSYWYLTNPTAYQVGEVQQRTIAKGEAATVRSSDFQIRNANKLWVQINLLEVDGQRVGTPTQQQVDQTPPDKPPASNTTATATQNQSSSSQQSQAQQQTFVPSDNNAQSGKLVGGFKEQLGETGIVFLKGLTYVGLVVLAAYAIPQITDTLIHVSDASRRLKDGRRN